MIFLLVQITVLVLLVAAIIVMRRRKKEKKVLYQTLCLIHLQRKLVDTNFQHGIFYLFDPDRCEECQKFNL